MALQQIGTLVYTRSSAFCVLWPFMTASVLHLMHPLTLRVFFVLPALLNEGVMDSNGRRPNPRAWFFLIPHAFHNERDFAFVLNDLKTGESFFAKSCPNRLRRALLAL